MKHRIAAALMILIVIFSCSCQNPAKPENGKMKIVVTVFPLYDWTMNVLGGKSEDAEVIMLMDSGVDLHSFKPTAKDIINIAEADLFIYVGGESDAWVEDALKQVRNEKQVSLNLLTVLGDRAKEEEAVEGMEAEGEEDEGAEEGPEYDEHIWLSLKNARVLTEKIRDALIKLDSENGDQYRKNATAYQEKLASLDSRYEDAVRNASVRTLLFGDRFPFRYLTDDYGLSYYAAFLGCSAETEASFETVSFLSKKVDELSLKCIMTIEGSDHRLAETIKKTTVKKNQKILTLDSMQSITKADSSGGVNYLSIMEKNLSVLKEALQ
ncbi:MAG: zinc ABC transporter substrate-binding protein [Lachnospiraceae bacterium]|nr:zinc ABC transporter substrate-binding protein [Lachnospiraceae bacterium]